MDPLYVRIPNAPEVKRKLLEVKKNIYLNLHDVIEDISSKNRYEERLNKILTKIGEFSEILDRLMSSIPSREEVEKIEKKSKKRKKGAKKEENHIEERKDYIKEELDKLEEELKKIQEELLRLTRY